MNVYPSSLPKSQVKRCCNAIPSVKRGATALFVRIIAAFAIATTALKVQAGVVFTELHSFDVFTNGLTFSGGLVQVSNGSFYGATEYGGTNGGFGTVFKISTNGMLTSIYSFAGGTDGAIPQGELVQGADGYLYGITSQGGTKGYGTIFKISTSGMLTTLYSFKRGLDGAFPTGIVQSSDGNFYGTTSGGGANGNGTVFKISTNGVLTGLYSFNAFTSSADLSPNGLIQGSDGNFYGTTGRGGIGGYNGPGTVFKITSGGAFTNIYSFSGSYDGSNPNSLVQGSDGNFYGTTYNGGTNGAGTVFKISSSGSFASLYSFTGGNDGSGPKAGLIQGSDGNFYGTACYGGDNLGISGSGTVFRIGADGGFTTLYSFTNGYDGSQSAAPLAQGTDGNFYGTTSKGGTNGVGTVFQLSPGGLFASLYSATRKIDGAVPQDGLVQGNDGNFYGTTSQGGAVGAGSVLQIRTNGTLNILYSFTNGGDGSYPEAGLVQGSDGSFYGTAEYGGTNGVGTVFQISSSGSFMNIYSFTGGNDGAMPLAGLIQGSDGNFYGTTSQGGTNNAGSIFKISPSGSFTSLYSFTGGNDGAEPEAGLVQGSDGKFYGTTLSGGTNDAGSIFKISSSGSLTSLYSFTGGNDGNMPQSGVIQGSDGNFYGTTESGGTNYAGTVFQISPGGSFISLYSFTGGNDGADPQAGLTLGSDGNLYGTTAGGGTNYAGTVFNISTNGLLTSLYSFTGGNDGAMPQAGVIQGSDGNFYGTTSSGGMGDDGVVFSISVGLEPTQTGHTQLSIVTNSGAFGFTGGIFGFSITGPAGSNIVVQTTTDLKTWIPVESNVLGSGAFYFSDPRSVTNDQRFYRLQMQ